LSAWVAENSFCIGQCKVADKSNEITAIPELLNQIHIKDSVVTIDAIGCQKEIAQTIRNKEANYLLSVKNNQKDLFEEVSSAFIHHKVSDISDTWEYDHGRYETRKASILSATEVLSPDLLGQWKDIKTIVQIKATRTIKDKKTEEIRYYISSENQDNPLYYNLLVRGHWAIENKLHWHLDVTFREDDCRARTANAPVNLSIMRKMALYLITQKLDTVSHKKKRFKASLNVEYMLSIMGF
jgi:predicted transposase YbfD/YdcC